MSIKLTLPISALTDPNVARAAAQLIEALGASTVPVSLPMQAAAIPAYVPTYAAPPVAEPVVDDATANARYQNFLDALPDRSRQFLDLVRSRGLLPISDAMKELGVDVGKAMGGITGSIARWAPEHEVTVPFEAVKGPDGRRAWRWIGAGAKPAPPVPVRARRRRRSAGSSTATARAPSMESRTAELSRGLPSETKRFLSMLKEQKSLSQPEVLARFGLARAAALTPIIRPLQDRAEALGLTGLFRTHVSSTGERSWHWGSSIDAGLEPPAALGAGARSAGRPGVLVRRRQAADAKSSA